MEIATKKPTTHLGLRVQTEFKKRLKAAAKGSGVSLSSFSLQLLAWALSTHEKEVARRAAR